MKFNIIVAKDNRTEWPHEFLSSYNAWRKKGIRQECHALCNIPINPNFLAIEVCAGNLPQFGRLRAKILDCRASRGFYAEFVAIVGSSTGWGEVCLSACRCAIFVVVRFLRLATRQAGNFAGGNAAARSFTPARL